MAFGSFKNLRDVALTFRVAVAVESFLRPVPLAVDERFQAELTFSLQNVDVRMSEASICEFLIAPVLKEVWKHYSDALLLWSHIPLGVEEPLVGIADYFFTRKSPLGLVQEQPYLVVIEAKRDDFDAGWGQCLAGLLAAQRMNAAPSHTLFGCVCNGSLWQFGKLEGLQFTRDVRDFVISDLPSLFAALNFVFLQAREQAQRPAA